MSYTTMAVIQNDYTLLRRVTACAAGEGIANPDQWVLDHAWIIATQPGWASAWDSAVATGIESPGRLEAVISDTMILAAVQAIQSAEA